MLGALVEKELTTPQGYPLTDNALLAACNQTTSREPVVTYDVATLRTAVRSLREQGLLRTVHRTGERSDKHRHELPSALDLSHEQVVVLAVLLLRGPQTAAELRARAERMHAFSSTEDVERVLGELAARGEPLAQRLERQPGRKEPRWVQRLAGPSPAPAARSPQAVVDGLLHELVSALRARDLDAAIRVFADDAAVLGAGGSERAQGREELRRYLSDLLAMPHTIGWEWDEVQAGAEGGVVWFLLSGELVQRDEAGEDRLPYRLSGVVAERGGRHRLAQLHGSLPAD